MVGSGDAAAGGSRSQSIAEVVESIGIGWAQMLMFFLGVGGIFFVEGVALVCFNLITMSVAKDSELHLRDGDQGMLTTMSFIGLFAGVSTSGYVADVFGRRLPIIVAYAIMTLSLFLGSVMQSWTPIIMAGFGTGFGVGFGMPAGIAMMSENTPVRWRIAMRAAAALMYNVGMAYICVFSAADDSSLQHVHWRRLLSNASIPCLILCVLSLAFLPESPVYYAAKGFKADAEKGFKTFAGRNSRSISGAYEIPESDICQTAMTMINQLKVIFSPQLWFITLVAIYASFCANVTLYGTMYANPQIFGTVSPLPAAWQILLTAGPSAIAVIMVGLVGDYMSRKTAVILGLSICSTGCFASCIGGGYALPRSLIAEVLFQYGTLITGCGVSLLFTVVFQISVEIFPTSSSATGAAIIIGVGRIGAIIAPQLFDFMWSKSGNWQSFYSFIGVCSLIGIILWMCVPQTLTTKLVDDDPKQEFAGVASAPDYSTMKTAGKEV